MKKDVGKTTETIITASQLEEDLQLSQEEKPKTIPWAKLLNIKVTTKDLERELNKRDLTTFKAVESRPNEVISAIQQAYGVQLVEIQRVAREFEEQ